MVNPGHIRGQFRFFRHLIYNIQNNITNMIKNISVVQQDGTLMEFAALVVETTVDLLVMVSMKYLLKRIKKIS